MPARCDSCGEEALTDPARFCIGCGAALPEVDPRGAVVEHAQRAPQEPPPVLHLPSVTAPPETPTRPVSRVDVPALAPRPVSSRSAPPQPAAPRPQRPPPPPPLRDVAPDVPLSLVVAGVIGLLALLLILLLAA